MNSDKQIMKRLTATQKPELSYLSDASQLSSQAMKSSSLYMPFQKTETKRDNYRDLHIKLNDDDGVGAENIKELPQISQDAQIKQNILSMDEQRVHRNTRFFKDYLKDQLRIEAKKGKRLSKMLAAQASERKTRRSQEANTQSNKEKESLSENHDSSQQNVKSRANDQDPDRDRIQRNKKLLRQYTIMKKAQSMGLSSKLNLVHQKSANASEQYAKSAPQNEENTPKESVLENAS